MTAAPLRWSIDTIPMAQAPSEFSFAALPEELEALKAYAGLEALTVFTAEVKVVPLGGGKFRASGTLKANAVQASVVNLEPVPASIGESFTAEYWPAEAIGSTEELPFDTDPPEPIVAGRIPLGMLLCELFAVSLDPYPRNEGDAFEWKPPEAPASVSPFASLAQLKPRKGGAAEE